MIDSNFSRFNRKLVEKYLYDKDYCGNKISRIQLQVSMKIFNYFYTD